MKVSIIVVAALVLIGGNTEAGTTQEPLNSVPLVLHFPRTIDTTSVSIRYFLTGSFGGYGNFVRTKSNTWDYAIDTSYENTPARTLKVIVFCPGYRVKLVDIPSLDDAVVRDVDVELRPLPSVQLSGKVTLPNASDNRGLRITATYCASWDHQFFGIADGAVSSFDIGSTDMSEDGSFSLMVPDFAHDPAVNSFKEHGSIELIAREPKTRNILYWLERASESGRDIHIQVAEDYGELTLYARGN